MARGVRRNFSEVFVKGKKIKGKNERKIKKIYKISIRPLEMCNMTKI